MVCMPNELAKWTSCACHGTDRVSLNSHIDQNTTSWGDLICITVSRSRQKLLVCTDTIIIKSTWYLQHPSPCTSSHYVTLNTVVQLFTVPGTVKSSTSKTKSGIDDINASKLNILKFHLFELNTMLQVTRPGQWWLGRHQCWDINLQISSWEWCKHRDTKWPPKETMVTCSLLFSTDN